MPEVNNHNEKPWYRKSSSWAWITIGVLILTYIIVSAVTDAQEKRAKQNQYKPKSYKEVFTPEEAKKMDIGGHIDGQVAVVRLFIAKNARSVYCQNPSGPPFWSSRSW